MIQKDDGSRNALEEFMRDRDSNCREILDLLLKNSQFWKARVFLELFWSYEALSKIEPSPADKDET